MDALVKHGIGASTRAMLPPECALTMPVQSFATACGTKRRVNTSSRAIFLRRFLVFGGTGALSIVAAYEMYQVLQVGGLTALESLILALFVILFAWIALSFVTSLIGFCVRDSGPAISICPDQPLPSLSSRTALLLPIYNEEPARVIPRSCDLDIA